MPGFAELKLEAGACRPDRILPSFPQYLQILSWQSTKGADNFDIFISTYYSIVILIFDSIKPRQLKTSLLEPRINQSIRRHASSFSSINFQLINKNVHQAAPRRSLNGELIAIQVELKIFTCGLHT